ncbi:hypothetical protein [Cryobacterium sp. CG_9.6]|uniref:hypothetical protein n=1 Tax=Cryobacterium sp. CG_9.6 TaxID=2760710 RepID=UPI002474B5CF|nr:hypothetical protein [Cryobacterium sp. CG_9.6]MDH6238234.1 chromosome segregation ATPase [Cryobacterium sp. CG_9.6]
MIEHLQQQLVLVVDDLQTIADPDAAQAQIESVTADAAEQVASAAARANRAETAMHEAEANRAEADAAAEESAAQVDDLCTALKALEQRAATLEKDLVIAREYPERATAEIATLTDQKAALSAENTATTGTASRGPGDRHNDRNGQGRGTGGRAGRGRACGRRHGARRTRRGGGYEHPRPA